MRVGNEQCYLQQSLSPRILSCARAAIEHFPFRADTVKEDITHALSKALPPRMMFSVYDTSGERAWKLRFNSSQEILVKKKN